MSQPIRAGYFYTFSGANTIDILYINPQNNVVYVLEAKGTQAGAAAGLVTRVSGNTQGTQAYLDEVAQDMVNSPDARKQEAGARIQTARASGVVRYIGVHTTYDASTVPYGGQVRPTLFDMQL